MRDTMPRAQSSVGTADHTVFASMKRRLLPADAPNTPDVCECWRQAYYKGQEESIFRAFASLWKAISGPSAGECAA